MRIVISLLFVSALLVLSQPVYAEKWILVGSGAHQCGKLLANLELEGIEGQVAEVMYEQWMLGYLSARNMSRFAANLPVPYLDGIDGQIRYVKNWCEENPLKKVDQAVEALWQELKVRYSIEE